MSAEDHNRPTGAKGVAHFITSWGAGERIAAGAVALISLPWTGLPKTQNDWLMIAAAILATGAFYGIAMMTRPDDKENGGA